MKINIFEEEVNVIGLRLNRSSGYGHYKLTVQFKIGEEEVEATHTTTNSVAFDQYQETDPGSKKEFLFNQFEHAIEATIEKYLNTI